MSQDIMYWQKMHNSKFLSCCYFHAIFSIVPSYCKNKELTILFVKFIRPWINVCIRINTFIFSMKTFKKSNRFQTYVAFHILIVLAWKINLRFVINVIFVQFRFHPKSFPSFSSLSWSLSKQYFCFVLVIYVFESSLVVLKSLYFFIVFHSNC